MRIVTRDMIPSNLLGTTKSMQNWGTFVGARPYYDTILYKKYPKYALTFLTKGLGNVFSKDSMEGKSFKKIDTGTHAIEWQLQNNKIPRIKIMEDCTDTGANGSTIRLILEKKYYNREETFQLDGTNTILFVVAAPRELAPNRWEYICRTMTPTATGINTSYLKAGKETQFISSYKSEFSTLGSTKFLYSTEVHREFIATHRVADSWTGMWAKNKELYVELKGRDGKGSPVTQYFKYDAMNANLETQMMEQINNSLMFSETTVDPQTGKCMLQDERGGDIIVGNGLIRQVEKVADKHSYSTFKSKLFDDAIFTIGEKYGQTTGLDLAVICTAKFFKAVQREMKAELQQAQQIAAYLYGKGSNGQNTLKEFDLKGSNNIAVGATFTSYEFAGNKITFLVDECLTRSNAYKDKEYAIFIDLKADDEGNSNINMYQIKGQERVYGTMNGLGGVDGVTSGDISTPAMGAERHLLSTSGLQVVNPYRSFVMMQNA